MSKLVKQRRDQLNVVPAKHGTQHGVVEVTQCGVGGYAADSDVITIFRQAPGCTVGGIAGKITAVTDATRNRKTPLPRLQGELRGGEYVPDNEVALEIGVVAVALVVRQAKRLDRETTRLLYQHQACREFL